MVHKFFSLSAKLPYTITKKGKWFVSSCPILDVHSQGRTEKKAKDNLAEALFLFMMSCLERNTLEGVLKECGFAANTVMAKNTNQKIDPKNVIDIPLYLLPKSNSVNTECHA